MASVVTDALESVLPTKHGNSRQPFDVGAYDALVEATPCFICSVAAADTEYRAMHEMIYEDACFLVFLNRFPTLYGSVLVCPREHREQVSADFTEHEYLRLQRMVYRVAEAVRMAVPTERIYILSLGSMQRNRHVHWHIAPLPPGIPVDEQQLHALDCTRGVFDVPKHEMAELAQRIRGFLEPV
jgi:diadenosine tetraphosphate (Ap4A) HIT family hydrolase